MPVEMTDIAKVTHRKVDRKGIQSSPVVKNVLETKDLQHSLQNLGLGLTVRFYCVARIFTSKCYSCRKYKWNG